MGKLHMHRPRTFWLALLALMTLSGLQCAQADDNDIYAALYSVIIIAVAIVLTLILRMLKAPAGGDATAPDDCKREAV